MTIRILLRSAIALALLSTLAGCAGNAAKQDTMAEMNSRIEALEDKVNTALRNSAAAKVDAATALHITTKQ